WHLFYSYIKHDCFVFFFFSSRRRHTRSKRDWSSDVCSSDLDMFTAFTGDNAKAGGVPILEDGMELKRNAFTSADEQWAESVKISLETVAQVYQVNPTMVGVLEGTNYSNM